MESIVHKHYLPLRKLSWDRAAQKAGDKLEFMTLGPSPAGANCMQIGEDDFLHFNIIECNALMNQLIREHGEPPEGFEFFICENHHEFGTYYELAGFFKPSTVNEKGEEIASISEDYCMKCESLPEDWDAEAIKELTELSYPRFAPKPPAKVVKHVGKVVNIKDKTA